MAAEVLLQENVARSNNWSIDRYFDRSLLMSIDRFAAEEKNARKIEKIKSKTKLKSKYAQNSNKLSGGSD